jgi:hypothetical protein
LLESIPPPDDLRILAETWIKEGRPAQPGIRWPRTRWETWFPNQRELFRSLPVLLDRPAVRRVAATAADGEGASERAFLAAMVWGFGRVGYGPHRTNNMLRPPETPTKLLAVARSVRNDGAVMGYKRLSGDCRIPGLGPAFGTKFLAFCQPSGAKPAALIHDDLVASWLGQHSRPDLGATTWSPPVYEAYLEQMHAWADALELKPEAVEYLIFQSMSDASGNQWASG